MFSALFQCFWGIEWNGPQNSSHLCSSKGSPSWCFWCSLPRMPPASTYRTLCLGVDKLHTQSCFCFVGIHQTQFGLKFSYDFFEIFTGSPTRQRAVVHLSFEAYRHSLEASLIWLAFSFLCCTMSFCVPRCASWKIHRWGETPGTFFVGAWPKCWERFRLAVKPRESLIHIQGPSVYEPSFPSFLHLEGFNRWAALIPVFVRLSALSCLAPRLMQWRGFWEGYCKQSNPHEAHQRTIWNTSASEEVDAREHRVWRIFGRWILGRRKLCESWPQCRRTEECHFVSLKLLFWKELCQSITPPSIWLS